MKQDEKKHLILFLMDLPKQQFAHLLKIITKEQLQAIIEIIYNVVQGVCTISEANTSILSNHKHLIRRLITKRSTLSQRKKLLLKIRNILPIFFSSLQPLCLVN